MRDQDHKSFQLLRCLRLPTLGRDVLIAVLLGLTLIMPCYAGLPDWWVQRGVLVPGKAADDFAALNAGQFKHAVTQAVAELNQVWASEGGAGVTLNSLVTQWMSDGAGPHNLEIVNTGQLKAVLKLWYDRLNAIHGTSGYPWAPSQGEDFFQAVNEGQLKQLLALDLTKKPSLQIGLIIDTEAQLGLNPPTGAILARSALQASPHHYLNNPLLGLAARGNNPLSLPANAENIPSAPVATSAGEFKVGQDGSANYTIRLQGPKGVGNVEPAITLDYNSGGGDGIVGIGWNLSGLSVINRGPATVEVDGFYDPPDFDANDRFYLDGERLICVAGVYGQDGSEYRTLKEQFSRVIYHKGVGEDWFEVQTKAGLRMDFGRCGTSCIGPKENGAWCAHQKTTWAVCKVQDSVGNYWSVEYADLSPGDAPRETTSYMPDYQPAVIRYTGHSTAGRLPMHEIRFAYEPRPDGQRGYLLGFLVRKVSRLRGVEIRTSADGSAFTSIRSWRLKYNLSSTHANLNGLRTMLQSVQEVAGALDDSQAPALPASTFTWEEGQRTWQVEPSPADTAGMAEQWMNWPSHTPQAFPETDNLRLEYRGNPWDNSDNMDKWFMKGAQYIDLDGDGLNEIVFNNRGVFWEQSSIGPPLYYVQNNHRYYLKRSSTANRWDVKFLFADSTGAPEVGSYPIPRKVSPSGGIQDTTPDFPFFSSSSNAPTGAFLMDLNQDGLPDIVSAGSFDEIYLEWVKNDNVLHTKANRRITNPSGVWLNVGGSFVKDETTDWRFPQVPAETFNSNDGTLTSTLPELKNVSFAIWRQFDLGWRVIDMDGDGDQDIIRAGKGPRAAGWRVAGSSSLVPTATGTAELSAQGRELCFGLRNEGPNAPAGQRWTLMNEKETLDGPTASLNDDPNDPAKHLKSIWKLPLPLVSSDKDQDMGRRLIDMNGDGLPDFVAQKKRNAAYTDAPFTEWDFSNYDIEVWLNRGAAGWEYGGDAWRLNGQMMAYGMEGGERDYGRMLQDLNGDGLPDFITSFYYTNSATGAGVVHRAVALNTGRGWVKHDKLNTPTDTADDVPVNFTEMGIPHSMFVRDAAENTITRSYSLMDLNGDGRPEFLHGFRPHSDTEIETNLDIGVTRFLHAESGWVKHALPSSNDNWNLPDAFLAEFRTPINFTEVDGDGIIDILLRDQLSSNQSGYTTRGTRTYLHKGKWVAPRIEKIINGLGVPMSITYGNLPELAGNTADHHYQLGTPSSNTQVSSTIPAAAVVTHYTTLDGTELTDGTAGGTITTSYYYRGLRSHALKGSLGFESMETRSTLSPVRQVTFFSQDWQNETVGQPLGGKTYQVINGQEMKLSESTSGYGFVDIAASLEVPGKRSRLMYAHTVTNQNWSPDGVYLGKTTSVSAYGSSGAELGMLTSQLVTLDQTTATDYTDDTSSSTVHEYWPWETTGGGWRIGQIKKTTVTSNAPDTPSVQKVSEFEYYPSGHISAGMLQKETIDPSATFAVTKEHVYDASGNEVKTITSSSSVAGLPELVSETWFSVDGRFPIAAVNALGHATVTTYDPIRSVATAATMAFQGPVPSTAASQTSNAAPTPPSGTLSTRTVYDAWATAKVTTAADGLKSVRYAMYFVDPALPRALYYVYEQAEGSLPVITYFDRYHRALLVEKTGFGGETILQEKQYDHKGRPVRVSKPYIVGAAAPAYTVEEFDQYDRKTKVTGPDGSWATISYNGFESSTTNHRGQTHKRRADMNERVVRSTDTDGNFVTFAYTADGQPRSSTTTYVGGTAASLSTTITTTYNAQRLKESVTDPNTGTSTIYYDAYGRTLATKDSMNHFTLFSYDLLGRTVKRWTGVVGWTGAEPTTSNYETFTETFYDNAPGFGLGKPSSVTFTQKDGANDRIVTESYVYDHLGRPISSTTTLSGQVALAYNGSYSNSTSYHSSEAPGYGRTATVTDPSGFTRASVYNALGFLAEVREGSAAGTLLWRGMAYDAEGRTLIEHHGNGLGTQNRYHPTRGFLESSLTFRASSNAALQELEMRVNDLGNVEWRRLTRYESAMGGAAQHTPDIKTEDFTFDSQNRLTSSRVIGQDTQFFAFAANGNITSKSGIGSYTYGQRNHGPHAVTSVSQGSEVLRSYTYDAKGRMTKEHVGTDLDALPLREIAYTSFDQPRFIQHWKSASLSSDLGELGTVQAAWDQVCTIQYYFGAGLQRLISVKHKGLLKTQTLNLGGYEIRETTREGTGTLVEKEERSSFGNGSKVKRWTATNPNNPDIEYEYGVMDHLGSDSVTYNSQGQEQSQRGHLKPGETQKTERQSYDAWGARRNGETWAPAKGQLGESNPTEERVGSNLARGYTGHEMLDDVGLVHMNGRLYDAALGRMCGADPYVQTPENLQNYNRYSYVLNNPLSQIDPSGHFIIGIIVALVSAIVGLIAGVIATVVTFLAYLAALAAQFVVTVVSAVGQAFGAMGSALLSAAKAGIAGLSANLSLGGVAFGKVYLGAALGAIYNGGQVAINGGSFSDVLKAAAIGAVTGAVGAVTGGFLHGFGGAIGGALTKAGMSKMGGIIAGKIIHAAAHGVVGGAMSAAQGGSFKDGFIGSLIGAGVSAVTGSIPGLDALEGDGALKIIARTAVASISGGAASALAGGKFADGAYSAAFFHLFNQEAQQMMERWEISRFDKKTIALYDGGDDGRSRGVAGAEDFKNAAEYYAEMTGGQAMNMRTTSPKMLQEALLKTGATRIMLFDHGKPQGYMQYNDI